MITTIFTLLVIYQVKHFLADFPFQTDWMLGKFKPGTAWIVPLTAHAGVHGAATLLIAGLFGTSIYLALGLALMDFTIHFTMDRIKASPDLMGRWKPLTSKEWFEAKVNSVGGVGQYLGLTMGELAARSEVKQQYKQRLLSNKLFWWAIGFDQMVHHLTHYAIILILVYNRI